MPGAFLTIFCLGVFYAAFHFRNNAYVSLAMILIGGLVLRIFVSADPFLHDWDERFHALVAKNLMSNFALPCLYREPILDFNYQSWGNNHVWLHKPPLSLWLMALSMKVFGVNEWGLRLPSILLSTASIYLTYSIIAKLYDPKHGLLASFFQSINGLVIETAGGRVPTDHVDTAFLFFIELAVFVIVVDRKWLTKINRILIVGTVVGLAVLCKWLAALLIVPLYFLFNYSFKRTGWKTGLFHSASVAIVAALIAAPWFYYTYLHFPKAFLWEQFYNFRHISEAVEGHEHPWWYFLDKARINFNELIYPVFAYCLFRAINGKAKTDWFLLVWMLIPYLVFSISKTKMPGYVLICSPAIFGMLAVFCSQFWEKKIFNKPVLHKLLIGLVVVFAFRYCFERVKPFQDLSNLKKEKADVLLLKNQLEHEANTVVFGCDFPIEAMFYTGATCYPNIPTIEELNNRKLDPKNVVIIDDGHLPQYIFDNNKCRVIKLRN